jgi:hypothetical protein
VPRREVTGRRPGVTGDLIGGPPLQAAYSIHEFCRAYRISVDTYYRMQRLGFGPRTMKVGARTLISLEAAAEWRREREEPRKPAASEAVASA